MNTGEIHIHIVDYQDSVYFIELFDLENTGNQFVNYVHNVCKCDRKSYLFLIFKNYCLIIDIVLQ